MQVQTYAYSTISNKTALSALTLLEGHPACKKTRRYFHHRTLTQLGVQMFESN